MGMSHPLKCLEILLVFGFAYGIGISGAANMRTVELVYDTEAAKMPDDVQKYASISGCYFDCTSGTCILQEEINDNFCLMLAAVLKTKDGNFREGHFDPKVGTNLYQIMIDDFLEHRREHYY